MLHLPELWKENQRKHFPMHGFRVALFLKIILAHLHLGYPRALFNTHTHTIASGSSFFFSRIFYSFPQKDL